MSMAIPTTAAGTTILPLEDPPRIRPDRLVDEQGKRRDGRQAGVFRPMFLHTGVTSQAAGSAFVEIGRTKVVCSVYGPRHRPQDEFSDVARLYCDFKFATFAGVGDARKKPSQTHEERELSMMMCQSLEGAVRLDRYPKSSFDVFALVVENDGAALSAAITCGSAALVDAGVEMFDIVVACAAGRVDGRLLLDPTRDEERWGEGASVVVASMPSTNELTQLIVSGVWSASRMIESVDLCLDGCSKLYEVVRTSLVESVKERGTKRPEST